MHTTQMSSKGQVIIPKDIRTRRHWLPGTRLVAEETPEGVLLRAARSTSTQSLEAGLAAMHALANHRGRPKTLAEMDAAVAREARNTASRSRAAGSDSTAGQALVAPRKRR